MLSEYVIIVSFVLRNLPCKQKGVFLYPLLFCTFARNYEISIFYI